MFLLLKNGTDGDEDEPGAIIISRFLMEA